ncbi:MAG TPA: helix-turn-helix transcriptional regulator [Acidimicrobiales bacterium]|nr:helix-turn-helix transcriptional regulator [Acidimicrobiales bacterium]
MAADRRTASLGEHLQELRRARGLTQRDLAEILKRSVSWVSQVERDELPVTETAMLQRLATALGVPARELVEIVLGNDAADEERQRPYVEVLRLALAGHPAPEAVLGPTPVRSAPEVRVRLRSQTARAWELIHGSRYEELGPLLADLIVKLELASRSAVSKKEAHEALELLSDAYQVAAAMLVKVGDNGAGWIAADRAINAGERCDDRCLVMAAEYRMAHTFVNANERPMALRVLRQAIEAAKGVENSYDPGLLSLTGACALLLAVLEAREGNGKDAERHLRTAGSLAAKLGADENQYGTEFGPTNVAVHAVAVAVELGNAGDALHRADKVDTSPLSPERQARFLVDVARAHAQRRALPQAVSILEQAYSVAPQEIAELRIVRDLLADLEHFAGRKRVPGLGPLRQQVTRS